jgi:hypothetical protein
MAAVAQSAYLAGHVAASVLADVVANVMRAPLVVLAWISVGGTAASLVVAVFFLKPVAAHDDAPSSGGAGPAAARPSLASSVASSLDPLRRPRFLALAVWWMVGHALQQFAYSHETSLFLELHPSGDGDWNGGVLGSALLVGSAFALLPARARVADVLARRQDEFVLVVRRPTIGPLHWRTRTHSRALETCRSGVAHRGSTWRPSRASASGLVQEWLARLSLRRRPARLGPSCR